MGHWQSIVVRMFVVLCGALIFTSSVCGQDAKDDMGWTGVLSEEDFAALHELNTDDAPPHHGEMIEIGGGRAYLSLPKEGKPTAAVLVIHEWWGLNDHIKHWADRLAADGYAALAVDLYGGVVATTREEAMASMRGVDEATALATLQGAFAFLADDPRIAAKKRGCIGWCFGGGWSLRLAMAAPDLDAAVLYYGKLVTDAERLKTITAPVLGVFADRDSGIPPLEVSRFAIAMKDAGRDLTVRRYEADHAFANPSSARYDAENAAKAWEQSRRFLREHLAPVDSGVQAEAEMSMLTASLGSADVKYGVPAGWRDAGAQTMRSVNLLTEGGTECYAMALPGAAGGVEANVQRWRSQLGQRPLTADELGGLENIEILGEEGVLVDVRGAYRGMGGQSIDDARMLGVIATLKDQLVFIKMIGPAADVEVNEAKFRAFCRSITWQ